MPADSPHTNGFSEREFYLAEFRGRALALAIPQASPDELPLLESVIARLEANRTRVLLLASDRALLEKLARGRIVDADAPDWVGRLWRAY